MSGILCDVEDYIKNLIFELFLAKVNFDNEFDNENFLVCKKLKDRINEIEQELKNVYDK